MQVDIHSLMNNFVRNQLDINLVDICLASILQISRKSLPHFVSI